MKKAVVQLNGNFGKHFKSDMEAESARQDFMGKFGDPLQGLDLRKPIVLWFPTYFMLIRIIFVISSIYFWDKPYSLLSVRLLTSICAFIILSIVRPFQSPFAT